MWPTNLICLLAISDYFCQGIKLMYAFFDRHQITTDSDLVAFDAL